MRGEEMEEVLTLLAEANPKTIFLELAFLESWVHAVNKHREGQGVPGEMLERAMPFLQREFRFYPKPAVAPAPALPGWMGRLAALMPLGLVGLAGLAR